MPIFMYLWDYSVYTLEYAEFNMKPKKTKQNKKN